MICYSLKNIDVHENNAYYKSVDGKLYSKDGTKFIQYALGKPDETFLVDSSVYEISYRAFSGWGFQWNYSDLPVIWGYQPQ